MNKLKASSHSEIDSNTQKGRFFSVIAIIGLAGIGGYLVGRDSRDAEVEHFKDEASTLSEKLLNLDDTKGQCQDVVNDLKEVNRFTRQRCMFALKNAERPDELQCMDIRDRIAYDKADEIASKLCITNPVDVERLAAVTRRGFTELDWGKANGRVVGLADPAVDLSGDRWLKRERKAKVVLSEPVGCLPSEYIENEFGDNETVTALKSQLANRQYEEILDDFDLESVCPSDSASDSGEEQFCQAFSVLHNTLPQVSDDDEKQDLLCNFYASLLGLVLENPSDPDIYSDIPYEAHVSGLRRGRKTEIYLSALAQSIGFGTGDFLESQMRCFVANHKGGQPNQD